MPHDKDERIVFGLSPASLNDGKLELVIGIPAACWERMKSGLTNTLDLTSLDLPIRMVLFGCKDHAEGKSFIEQVNALRGIATLDETRRDFSIKEKPEAGEKK